ncbi:MAG: hypothetical protein H6878_06260 [Rhodobiaceae bacterium]|nr:hypothetical protein [Rhodobiaceae bacterium]MCC0040681.1 hypothetical protein [Rhodobiaceae bacterium]
MRRQTLFGGLDPAWVAGAVRLDPNELPARIAAQGDSEPGAASPVAVLDRTSVTIARSARGPFLKVPVASYAGVVLAASAAPGAGAGLVLYHETADFCVPLNVANEGDELEADWRTWGETLSRPLFFAEPDGELHEVGGRLGSLKVGFPRARRANSFFAARRPAFLAGRHVGSAECIRIHPVEAEIIARA